MQVFQNLIDLIPRHKKWTTNICGLFAACLCVCRARHMFLRVSLTCECRGCCTCCWVFVHTARRERVAGCGDKTPGTAAPAFFFFGALGQDILDKMNPFHGMNPVFMEKGLKHALHTGVAVSCVDNDFGIHSMLGQAIKINPQALIQKIFFTQVWQDIFCFIPVFKKGLPQNLSFFSPRVGAWMTSNIRSWSLDPDAAKS